MYFTNERIRYAVTSPCELLQNLFSDSCEAQVLFSMIPKTHEGQGWLRSNLFRDHQMKGRTAARFWAAHINIFTKTFLLQDNTRWHRKLLLVHRWMQKVQVRDTTSGRARVGVISNYAWPWISSFEYGFQHALSSVATNILTALAVTSWYFWKIFIKLEVLHEPPRSNKHTTEHTENPSFRLLLISW